MTMTQPRDIAADDAVNALATQLADAFRSGRPIDDAAGHPATPAEAYTAQQALLRRLGWAASAWKVGAKASVGPIQGAPLPARGVVRSGTDLSRDAFGPLALELEIAFRFERGFASREQPYEEAEVLEGVGTMLATIEIVASRFRGGPPDDKLVALADLQNHGALIAGDEVAYDPGFDFTRPTLRFLGGGRSLVGDAAHGSNPAGDPRRLLPWVVNHHTRHGLDLPPGMLVTTGSYTGLCRPDAYPALLLVEGSIAGLPSVELRLHSPGDAGN